jgi:hypothetical protein
VLFDGVLHFILDAFQVISVPCIICSDWYGACSQQVVVQVELVVVAILDYPNRCIDGACLLSVASTVLGIF